MCLKARLTGRNEWGYFPSNLSLLDSVFPLNFSYFRLGLKPDVVDKGNLEIYKDQDEVNDRNKRNGEQKFKIKESILEDLTRYASIQKLTTYRLDRNMSWAIIYAFKIKYIPNMAHR